MPQYNRAELGRMATESGFVRDTFEKVLRLKEILKFLNEDKSLREHLLLKGGTAINLTVFNLPRLSVDIDMDYTPNDTREGMLECRAKITDIIKEYMESEGYELIHEKPGLQKLYKHCYKDNLHSIWAVQELYRKGNSPSEFINILGKNMQPVYDSARRQGYEIWKVS